MAENKITTQETEQERVERELREKVGAKMDKSALTGANIFKFLFFHENLQLQYSIYTVFFQEGKKLFWCNNLYTKLLGFLGLGRFRVFIGLN